MNILEFQGKYRFLSNFWPVVIEYEGEFYSSVEHAYQAAKFKKNDRNFFRLNSTTAAHAKHAGAGKGPPEWEETKIMVMYELLQKKFKQEDLKIALLATGDVELIEGNAWGDIYWGVCNGVGENWLGKIIMKVREELK